MGLEIDVSNLSVRYGRVEALKDISFRLSGRKIYGLLGPNGSGKTSLLSVVAGFRKASAGCVRVGGEATFENPRVMRQVCFIRDTVDVDEDGTVGAALRFAAQWRPNWDVPYAESLARRFDLPLDRKVRALSRGKRSALGIVLGLASRAPVTIFDDAHLGLDVPSRYTFYEELLEDYMAHPRTIILASHLIAEMEHLLEEVVIIDRGKLVLHQDAETLRSAALTVSGSAGAVDHFATGRRILFERSVAGKKMIMVYGALDEEARRQAQRSGLEMQAVTIQDLFVHLVRHQEVAS